MPKHGCFTPSRFADAMTNERGKDTPGKAALNLAVEVAMERIGVIKDEVYSPALQWGKDHEPLAIKRYMELTFVEVEPVLESLVHPDYDFVAGIPDGMIDIDGLLEVKCPHNKMNHFANILCGEQIRDYYPQKQGYMWITKARWCDFVSFDPRYPKHLDTVIYRVERDQDYIDRLEQRIILLNKLATELVRRIEQRVLQGLDGFNYVKQVRNITLLNQIATDLVAEVKKQTT